MRDGFLSQSRSRVLVAGGAGFIGSHLCEALLGHGHDVVCVDNFQTGSFENISHLAVYPRFSLVEHDVCTLTLGPRRSRACETRVVT